MGERLADRNPTLTRVAGVAKERAPDGIDVYPLSRANGGSMARFELGAGRTSIAVSHRTVDELWYVISGRGELWRSPTGVVSLDGGTCVAIASGTGFQVRAGAGEPLVVVAVTMPAWPGDEEAVRVEGPWKPDF